MSPLDMACCEQVERLRLVDGNIMISELYLPQVRPNKLRDTCTSHLKKTNECKSRCVAAQGSFKSLEAVKMTPQQGMEWMRGVSWGTLVAAAIAKWVEAYPETEDTLNQKRARMVRGYSDCERENFLCEERRNRGQFPPRSTPQPLTALSWVRGATPALPSCCS